jgi:hypothetical protein
VVRVIDQPEPTQYPDRRTIVRWVEQTVLAFGGQHSTALRCAAEFAAAFERGEIVAPLERAQGRRGDDAHAPR